MEKAKRRKSKEGELKSKKQKEKLDKKRKKAGGIRPGRLRRSFIGSGMSWTLDVKNERQCGYAAAAEDVDVVPPEEKTTMISDDVTDDDDVSDRDEEYRRFGEGFGGTAMAPIVMNLLASTNSPTVPEPKSSQSAKKCFEEKDAKKSCADA